MNSPWLQTAFSRLKFDAASPSRSSTSTPPWAAGPGVSSSRFILRYGEDWSTKNLFIVETQAIMASDGSSEPKKLKLYSYWRSSCSCRVRIALNLKGLDYEYISLNLLKGEHKSPEFLKLNPLGLVPVLIDGDTVVSDSLAILLYLEEKYPQRPLLPQDLHMKTLNYQAVNIVFASIQPYQNIPIIGYIKEKLGADEMLSWIQHRIKHGFAALEKLLEKHAGKYATGDEVFLADLYLAPQIDGAVVRFNVDMNEFPLLSKINEAYKELPAFQDALPRRQPDTPPEARD